MRKIGNNRDEVEVVEVVEVVIVDMISLSNKLIPSKIEINPTKLPCRCSHLGCKMLAIRYLRILMNHVSFELLIIVFDDEFEFNDEFVDVNEIELCKLFCDNC